MSNEIVEMPFLRNIGFIITYRCQVECPHCIIEAGPHRTEEMSIRDAFNWIEQVSNYRGGYIKVLSLTGGEPFYNMDNLKKISTFGETQGLLISVVTNAFWAFSPEKAVRVLRELSAIKMLAISTDVYHQESIPFERVKNAILAARECDIPYNVHVCTENEDDIEYKKTLSKLHQIAEHETINTAITFPAGRALKKLGSPKYETTENPPIPACSAGSSPIVFPDGRVIACIGPVIDLLSPHPLMLGDLRHNSLNEILNNAELNPILHAIRIWGPHKLISIIKKTEFNKYLPSRYIRDSVCNACYNLMSSEKIVEYLSQLTNDFEFRRKVAYGRIYYLKETRMVELMYRHDS